MLEISEFILHDRPHLAMVLEFPPTHPLIVAQTQVMLPKGAFIRPLPLVVEPSQRFRIDALVTCADILASAYIQMIDLATRSRLEDFQSEETRLRHIDIAMVQHAWSIVDQIYSLQRLIRTLEFKNEEIDSFLSVAESAIHLRNRMDHLDQRIPNIVLSKEKRQSLFGSISYFVCGSAVGAPNVDVYAVILYAEPIRPNDTIGEIRIPDEIRMPVGNFLLTAAGYMLDIDATILALGPVMTRINVGIEKNVRAQVAEKAAEHGISQSDLLSHHGASLKIMLAMKIGESPDPSL